MSNEQPTLVVNAQTSRYDVYIGRGSIWGNRYSHRPSKFADVVYVGTRDQAVHYYRRWIEGQPELLAQLHTLKGKWLGCPGCNPDTQLCHGHILAELADALP